MSIFKLSTISLLILSLLTLFTACSDDTETITPAPSAVTLSVYSGVTTNSIFIKWTANIDATNYRLLCNPLGNTNIAILANTTDTSFTHSGLPADATYQYQVIVEGPGGESLINDIQNGTTAAEKTVAPSNITNYVTNSGMIYTYDPATQTRADNELVILTLNMHTYQETGQDAKFDKIVKLIADLDVDVIAFQENAQNRNSAIAYDAIRVDNMCAIITNRLKTYYGLDYYFAWDWAHYGWTVWEEGIAVMAKYPLDASESTWVSTSQSTGSIISRKAIYGQFNIPRLGINLNLISTHLHWRLNLTDIEQNTQVTNVKNFATSKLASSDLTIVCGDFNSQPTEDPTTPWGEGYETMMQNGEYVDTFLSFNPAANTYPEISAYDTVKGDYPGRIDYIFMRTNANFAVLSSQIIFTPTILGEVSDHYGVITRFRKN